MRPPWDARTSQNQQLNQASLPKRCVTLANRINLSVPQISRHCYAGNSSKKPPILRDSQTRGEVVWVLVAWVLSLAGDAPMARTGLLEVARGFLARGTQLPCLPRGGALRPRTVTGRLTSSATSWPRSSGFSSGNRSSCSPAMVTSWSRSPGERGRGRGLGLAAAGMPQPCSDSRSTSPGWVRGTGTTPTAPSPGPQAQVHSFTW